MRQFIDFFTRLKTYGLEYFGLYYSFYWAECVDNNDPENLNRIKFNCHELNLAPDYWALPSMGVSKGHGLRIIPSEGDQVLIRFKNGNPRQAIWGYGQTILQGQIQEADSPNKYVFKTPQGILMMFDDDSKTYTIKTPDGLCIKLDNGIASIGSGSEEYSVKGQTLQAQLNTDKAKLDALIQAITAAPVVAGDGGASFKASLIASLSAVPSANYSNVLATKFKSE